MLNINHLLLILGILICFIFCPVDATPIDSLKEYWAKFEPGYVKSQSRWGSISNENSMDIDVIDVLPVQEALLNGKNVVGNYEIDFDETVLQWQGTYIVGWSKGVVSDGTTSELQSNSGGKDIVLTKYKSTSSSDPNMEYEFTRQRGSSLDDWATSIHVSRKDGSIYVCGVAQDSFDNAEFQGGDSDIFITKFTNTGIHIWTKFVGGTGEDVCTDVFVDDVEDTVVVLGFSDSSIFTNNGSTPDINNGGFDAVVVLLDTDGELLWNMFWGSSSDEFATCFVRNPVSGNWNVGGYTDGSPDGLTNTGGNDVFLLILNSTANSTLEVVSSHLYGSLADDIANAIDIDPIDQSIVIVGSTDGLWNEDYFIQGLEDVLVLKISSGGTLLDMKGLGSPASDVAYSVSIDKGQKAWVCGYTDQSIGQPFDEIPVPGGNGDMFVSGWQFDTKFVPNHKPGSSILIGSSGTDIIKSCVFGQRDLYLVGSVDIGDLSYSSSGLNSDDLYNFGRQDMYHARLLGRYLNSGRSFLSNISLQDILFYGGVSIGSVLLVYISVASVFSTIKNKKEFKNYLMEVYIPTLQEYSTLGEDGAPPELPSKPNTDNTTKHEDTNIEMQDMDPVDIIEEEEEEEE